MEKKTLKMNCPRCENELIGEFIKSVPSVSVVENIGMFEFDCGFCGVSIVIDGSGYEITKRRT